MNIPDKPKFGSPCNNCGICCSTEICGIGKMVYGNDHPAPCPSLIPIESKQNKEIIFLCDFVIRENITASPKMISDSLGIGRGCCSDD